MEDTLSELQKVGDELAANPGRCGFGIAGDLHYCEVSIGRTVTASENSKPLLNPKGLKKQPMINAEKLNGNNLAGVASEGTWPGIDSRFRLIIVAGLRTKQLLHGSKPRIEADKARRRNTSIALEEVKRGLVQFTELEKEEKRYAHGGGLD